MKALSVFSGGLDSLLASELLRVQGIDVLALFFQTPFFDAHKARQYAEQIRLPLRVVDITESHLEVVKHPAHGYGENMNPCIDCHTLMIRTAGDLLEEEGASFIATGEVLGQRPMSQNRKALSIVERECGYAGLVLRPLSAKRLPPTLAEEKGWVNREELKGFSGRSRKPQMALARELGIRDYPSPAGGCLLTDRTFTVRLKDLLASDPNPEIRDIDRLKVGRHFRIGRNIKVIVGRNKRENQVIQSLASEADTILQTVNVPGPTALLCGDAQEENGERAAAIVAAYSDAKTGDPAEIRLQGPKGERVLTPPLRDKGEFRHLMV
ncbi:MAG: tRNA 4-thiouridine(8) synthase ThiI [Desulfobacteraceae bacterium]|jgi:tRNA U34 2-thiouridine synthase MnmA/TrmU